MTLAQHFIQQYDEDEVVALCGLTPETFVKLFNKYCGRATPIKKPLYLWLLFKYFKIYPVHRAFRALHEGRYKSRRNMLSRIHVWEVSLHKISLFELAIEFLPILIAFYRY
jgi:hypothetical protein